MRTLDYTGWRPKPSDKVKIQLPQVWALIKACWSADSSKRPPFWCGDPRQLSVVQVLKVLHEPTDANPDLKDGGPHQKNKDESACAWKGALFVYKTTHADFLHELFLRAQEKLSRTRS